MRHERLPGWWATACAAVLIIGHGGLAAADEETPQQAGEQVGIEGTFVRVAENPEGWVVVGYKIANEEVGKEWMLLDVGMTVQRGQKPQTITRDQLKLVTPDKQVLSLATQKEYEEAAGSLAAMERRANEMGDSINYFPAGADRPCRIGFFTDLAHPMRGPAFDQVELDSNAGCVGRVYFHVPGGIQLGNYNFDVKFADSVVKVPIEIMTEEQAKEFEKKWKEAQKEAKHEGHEH